MNPRFLIPVLCVGAVVFACSPRARSDAKTANQQTLATAKTTTPAARASRAARAESKRPVSAEVFVRASDESVRLALRVVNNSRKRVELVFPSGQTYDFVILDSLDREVWRWARGRMFTQTLRNRLLSGGEALDVDETWDEASLSPGRYTARAQLTSENHPLVAETRFTVHGTTIASR